MDTSNIKKFFEDFAKRMTDFTGSTIAFVFSCFIIIVWLATGPIFHYSDTWQLIINTGTTIITFLMVFLIQRTQNKDSLAIHLKLNELIASHKEASNRLIDAENLTEDELIVMHQLFQLMTEKLIKEKDLKKSHSIEEAEKLKDIEDEIESKKQKLNKIK